MVGVKIAPIILDIENTYSNTQGCLDRDLKKWGESKAEKKRGISRMGERDTRKKELLEGGSVGRRSKEYQIARWRLFKSPCRKLFQSLKQLLVRPTL